MNSLFEIIQYEILFIFIVSKYTDYKIKSKYYFNLFIIVLAFILFSCFFEAAVVRFMVLGIIYGLFPTLYFKNKNYKSILYISMLIIGLSSFINGCISFLLSLFSNNIRYSLFEYSIQTLITVIVVSLINAKFISNVLLDMKSISKKVKIIVLIFIWELFVSISALNVIFNITTNKIITTTIGILVISTILISILIVFILISDNIRTTYYAKLNKIMEKSVLQKAGHIQRITEANENIKRFQHDVKNMAIGLRNLLDLKDVDGAKIYLDEFYEKLNSKDYKIHTGNSFLDALIAEKEEKMESNNIVINFNGYMPSESLNPIDLCIAFGNALDNAIEACCKFPFFQEKEIDIHINLSANMLSIVIINPVIGPVNIKNNQVITTKQNQSEHGMGINSIRKVTEKYHGNLTLKCHDNKFKLEMLLFLNTSVPIKSDELISTSF